MGSGPTVGDESTAREALEIFARYKIAVPEAVEAHLHSAECETLLASDPLLSASDMCAGHAAEIFWKRLQQLSGKGWLRNPVILGDALEGGKPGITGPPARWHKKPLPAPIGTALISGGETTVIVTGKGKGGRNAEFIHALALNGALRVG